LSGTQQDVVTLPAMVTLPIARWNQVLEVLGAQPWREVNPLIVDIHRQIQDAVDAQQSGSQHGEARLKQVNPV
jgi:hypothetical protein